MRVFYIVLANLALPFLLFYLRNVIYKLYYTIVLKDKEKDAPKLDWKKFIQLLSCGVVLLAAVLVYFRLQDPIQQREDSLQVKQYDFR